MATVLVVVLGASALAFFGRFFVAICHDKKQSHVDEHRHVEVVRLSTMEQRGSSATELRQSA